MGQNTHGEGGNCSSAEVGRLCCNSPARSPRCKSRVCGACHVGACGLRLQVLGRMKQAMVEHSSSASHSFLLDDDSTLPFVANEILAQMDDKVGGGIRGSVLCNVGGWVCVCVCRMSCWHDAVCACRASRQQQAHLLHCIVVDQAVLHCTPVCPCLCPSVCAGPVCGPASARRPQVRRECWQLCFPGEGAAVQPDVTLLRRCCSVWLSAHGTCAGRLCWWLRVKGSKHSVFPALACVCFVR